LEGGSSEGDGVRLRRGVWGNLWERCL
jgi:hypothetical protein